MLFRSMLRPAAATLAARAAYSDHRPLRSERLVPSVGSEPPHATIHGVGPRRVRLLQVLHRHGARTPTHHWPPQITGLPQHGTQAWDELWGRCPSTPIRTFKGGSFAPMALDDEQCSMSSLTFTGLTQLRSLGSYLDSKYSLRKDLGILYPCDLMVCSTVSKRAILSAAALLQGIYPGISLDDAFARIQLPYELYPEQETKWATQAPPRRSCPRLNQLSDESRSSNAAIFGSTQEAKDVLQHVDQCRCLLAEGYSHANCSDIVTRDVEAKAYRVAAHVEEASDEGACLSGARLVAEIHDLIERAVANPRAHEITRTPSLAIHSGHDVSIISFLRALGYPLNAIPRFASSVLIELIEPSMCVSPAAEGDDWIVRVIYYDSLPSAESFGQDVLSLSLTAWRSKVSTLLDIANLWNERCRKVNL